MDNNNNTNEFNYTYSASEQAELKRIRDRYVVREEDKMERLRRLDRSVYARAQTVALTIGIIGALILGTGMSLFMSELSEIFGMHSYLAMPIGIGIGTFGMILTIIAYPIYNFVLEREKKRVAPEIIKLTDELMK
jgi:hypothetical protein